MSITEVRPPTSNRQMLSASSQQPAASGQKMYDAIVVGAGPGGSVAALRMAGAINHPQRGRRFRVRVGQVIVLGMSPIVATDETGWFPINNVAGITDLYRKAIELCGGQRAAERWLHRDHSAIRRRIERSENRRQNRGD